MPRKEDHIEHVYLAWRLDETLSLSRRDAIENFPKWNSSMWMQHIRSIYSNVVSCKAWKIIHRIKSNYFNVCIFVLFFHSFFLVLREQEQFYLNRCIFYFVQINWFQLIATQTHQRNWRQKRLFLCVYLFWYSRVCHFMCMHCKHTARAMVLSFGAAAIQHTYVWRYGIVNSI